MDLDLLPLASILSLSPAQKSRLSAGGVKTPRDLLIPPPNELARKLKISLDEFNGIVDLVCRELEPKPRVLSEMTQEIRTGRFTTGDELLDKALGGGIRAGMLWEFCGEGSAGKTQLALQLALMVQLPPTLGGINGSCCYITTKSSLPTSRLNQILSEHPLLSDSAASLTNIRTALAASAPSLLSMLTYTVPHLVRESIESKPARPIRLIVLDSITALFYKEGKTTTQSLVQRSKMLCQIAARLKWIATKMQVAVVILNGVMDIFTEPPEDADGPELLYQHQIQWVSRADSIPSENKKEAALGLVWSNQLNARIMMTRTNRRWVIESDASHPSKKRKVTRSGHAAIPTYEDVHHDLSSSVPLRRMSVIFCAVAPPVSLDYIIDSSGLSAISIKETYLQSNLTPNLAQSQTQGQEVDTTRTTSSGALNEAHVPQLPSGLQEVDLDADEVLLWSQVDDMDDMETSEMPLFDAVAAVDPENREDALWEQISDMNQIMALEGDTSQHHQEKVKEVVASDDPEEALWINMPDLSQYVEKDQFESGT